LLYHTWLAAILALVLAVAFLLLTLRWAILAAKLKVPRGS
jgi:hypothetical protein